MVTVEGTQAMTGAPSSAGGTQPTNTTTQEALYDKLKESLDSNPSVLREFIEFALDEKPELEPITENSHPLYWDASKNPSKLIQC
jgi:hypothetical protein